MRPARCRRCAVSRTAGHRRPRAGRQWRRRGGRPGPVTAEQRHRPEDRQRQDRQRHQHPHRPAPPHRPRRLAARHRRVARDLDHRRHRGATLCLPDGAGQHRPCPRPGPTDLTRRDLDSQLVGRAVDPRAVGLELSRDSARMKSAISLLPATPPSGAGPGQGVAHLARRGVAPLARDLQRPADDLVEDQRHVRSPSRRQRPLALEDRLERLELGVAVEQRGPGHRLVQRRPQGEQVAASVERVPADLLGGQYGYLPSTR